MEAVDLGSSHHEAFGAILPFMNENFDGGDVEKEQVLFLSLSFYFLAY